MPQCDNHPELPAAFILGMTETGDQSFLCADCMAVVGLSMALTRLGADEIADAAAKAKEQGAQAPGATPAKPPARKRAAKPANAGPASVLPVAAGTGNAPAPDGR